MTASVISSSGVSPLSGLDTDESSESYVLVDGYGGMSSNSSSIVFLESPGSGSYQSLAFVGQPQFVSPSPPAMSPNLLDMSNYAAAPTSAGGYVEDNGSYDQSAASMEAHPDQLDQLDLNISGIIENQETLDLSMLPQQDWTSQLQGWPQYLTTSSTNFLQAEYAEFENASHISDLGIPQSMINMPDLLPWNPTNPQQNSSGLLFMNSFTSPPSTSESISPEMGTVAPVSPQPKQEPSSVKASIPSPKRRVRGTGNRVEKKRATSSSDSSSLGSSPTSKFVIMTPNTISAHAGKTNPYECMDAMRPSQRGRKGPLANATKENALQVRRRGACFHCHARKVKCDMERPCKNCKKLITDIPQVMCWQFQDFVPILFPEFIRGHFDSKALYNFSKEFKVYGVGRWGEVVLSSGWRFATTLRVHVKKFAAIESDVQTHWHLKVDGDVVQLFNETSLSIGLETVTESPKDELRKVLKSSLKGYFEDLIKEHAFAEQVTETLVQRPELFFTREIMQAVCEFYWKSNPRPELVRRALLICAMHYVMTRQLTIQAVEDSLEIGHLIPQRSTSRLLNRQIKSIIDELMQQEMRNIFEDFSRSLKSKSKKEWAPCLAAFLVTCLFMESIESATDLFAISENEISLEKHTPMPLSRQKALKAIDEIDNMPFSQFAFQFHQVFMTHTNDTSAKAFNPLKKDSILEPGDLDAAAQVMTNRLWNLLYNRDNVLQQVVQEPILPNIEHHPYPSNTVDRYAGHLCSRFLLTFVDEKYLFGRESS